MAEAPASTIVLRSTYLDQWSQGAQQDANTASDGKRSSLKSPELSCYTHGSRDGNCHMQQAANLFK